MTVCISNNYTVSQKNIPDDFSYNSRKHCPIFMIFGKSITEKVRNQKMIYFLTTPNLCSCTTLRNWKHGDCIFSRKYFMLIWVDGLMDGWVEGWINGLIAHYTRCVTSSSIQHVRCRLVSLDERSRSYYKYKYSMSDVDLSALTSTATHITSTSTSIYWHSCGPKAEQLDKTRKGWKNY